MADAVTLSLISHTNVGKTTLARTLLRRDVGEVLDQAHVTDENTAYDLIECEGDTLVLWDTPGFGDTARLMRRLRHSNDPLGWFLHQVWDRWVDRPMWCSQQAVVNVSEQADVVLYLVNASEHPGDAGYPALELDLLTWINRPVLILLNQVGDGGRNALEVWREFATRWPLVRNVLSLDAFTRCWVEETVLLEAVVEVLDGRSRETMSRLADAWDRRNRALFAESCRNMGRYLGRAAVDRQHLDDADTPSRGPLEMLSGALKLPRAGKNRAMESLGRRLDRSIEELMTGLIADHGLVGESAKRIERQIRDFRLKGGSSFDERSGAAVGAVVSGALGGLAADALSGGLTLGGGLIAGTILGALGGTALAKGYRLVGGSERPTVRWSAEFLDELFRQIVLHYLAVAHFGRGQGPFRDREQPAHWSAAVDAAISRHTDALHRVWKAAEPLESDEGDRLADDLAATFESVAGAVLSRAYGN